MLKSESNQFNTKRVLKVRKMKEKVSHRGMRKKNKRKKLQRNTTTSPALYNQNKLVFDFSKNWRFIFYFLRPLQAFCICVIFHACLYFKCTNVHLDVFT